MRISARLLKRQQAALTPRLFTCATPVTWTLALRTAAVWMPAARMPAAHKFGDYVIAPFKAVLRECVV
ncbi:hypothetical protein [Paraburkholderia sp. BL23I1N1]|uniref:hypothetical protein n=1 Tax=Paraburkholderia sp. BL23I1N1 TaxID=1938802 RepID=UPI000E730A77|nr:hypothetical protein [Paraburkholderia sp. BL23I1N1]